MVPARDGRDDASGGAGSGVLGRGFRPSPRIRAAGYLLLGVLLIAQPLVGGLPDAVGLTGNVEYAAVELSPDGGEVDSAWVEGRNESAPLTLSDHGGLALLDCYPRFVESSACAVESGLTDGSVAVAREPPDWGGFTYHGRVYRRVALGSGDIRLGLRPVPARDALAEIAIPARDWPDPIERAVEEGSVSADPPLRSAGAVLERDGRFYAVVPTEFPRRDEPAGPVYTAALTVAGVLSVQRGRRLARE